MKANCIAVTSIGSGGSPVLASIATGLMPAQVRLSPASLCMACMLWSLSGAMPPMRS